MYEKPGGSNTCFLFWGVAALTVSREEMKGVKCVGKKYNEVHKIPED